MPEPKGYLLSQETAERYESAAEEVEGQAAPRRRPRPGNAVVRDRQTCEVEATSGTPVLCTDGIYRFAGLRLESADAAQRIGSSPEEVWLVNTEGTGNDGNYHSSTSYSAGWVKQNRIYTALRQGEVDGKSVFRIMDQRPTFVQPDLGIPHPADGSGEKKAAFPLVYNPAFDSTDLGILYSGAAGTAPALVHDVNGLAIPAKYFLAQFAGRDTTTAGANRDVYLVDVSGHNALAGLTALTTSTGPTLGGTGLTSYTTGDLIYASATNVLSKRGIGATGSLLWVAAGIPAWFPPGSNDGDILTIASGVPHYLARPTGGSGKFLLQYLPSGGLQWVDVG